MSTPIEDQLRDYFRMVDRMQDPVDIDSVAQPADTALPSSTQASSPTIWLVNNENHTENDIYERENPMLAPNTQTDRRTDGAPDARPVTHTGTRPERRRTTALVAAAAAVVALVGGLIVAGSLGDDQPPADQPPVPVVEPDNELGTLPPAETEAPSESLGDVGTEVLVPEFVLSSRLDAEGDIVSDPTVEMGADELGCTTLSYVDSTGGTTTDRIYTCESGERTGTFTIRFRPQSYANADFLSGWAVTATSGDFLGLRGGGFMYLDINEVTGEAGQSFVGTIEYVTIDSAADGSTSDDG